VRGQDGVGPPSARRILVDGRVQGVGFRYATMARADLLGVDGWARNLADGRVEVHAQGEPGALAELVGWLSVGPPAARVTSLEEQPAAVDPGLSGFVIRR